MFIVLFEVHPKADQAEAYLSYARLLKPELEKIDGFVENVRYRSLTREGWILSLSGWRDEESLVRWRTHPGHHIVQSKGRASVFADYHLQVGELTRDTRPGPGVSLREQRLDETVAGEASLVTLIDAQRPPELARSAPADTGQWLGLAPQLPGLISWDLFDAVLTPGNIILRLSWRDHPEAETFERSVSLPAGARLRGVRVIRDYGMFDRREAPQYFPDIPDGTTIHA